MPVHDDSDSYPLTGAALEERAQDVYRRIVIGKASIPDLCIDEAPEVLVRAMQLISESSSSGNINEQSRAAREALRCFLDARHAAELTSTLRELAQEAHKLEEQLHEHSNDFLKGLAAENEQLQKRLSSSTRMITVAIAVVSILLGIAAWRLPVAGSSYISPALTPPLSQEAPLEVTPPTAGLPQPSTMQPAIQGSPGSAEAPLESDGEPADGEPADGEPVEGEPGAVAPLPAGPNSDTSGHGTPPAGDGAKHR